MGENLGEMSFVEEWSSNKSKVFGFGPWPATASRCDFGQVVQPLPVFSLLILKYD